VRRLALCAKERGREEGGGKPTTLKKGRRASLLSFLPEGKRGGEGEREALPLLPRSQRLCLEKRKKEKEREGGRGAPVFPDRRKGWTLQARA